MNPVTNEKTKLQSLISQVSQIGSQDFNTGVCSLGTHVLINSLLPHNTQMKIDDSLGD